MANIITKPYTVATNKNLIVNGYFVGGGTGDGVFPVNQRGITTHSGTGYSIDRWKGGNASGSCALTANGFAVTGNTNVHGEVQVIENGAALLNGKTVTLSALLGNGMLIKGTVKVSLTATNRDLLTIPTPTGSGAIALMGSTSEMSVHLRGNNGQTATFAAVKLELGDCQTLAHYVQDGASFYFEVNEIPNYQQELAKCQRYLVMWNPSANSFLGFGAVINSGTIGVQITLPVSMRSGGTAIIVGTAPSAWKNATIAQYTITNATIQSVCGNMLSLILSTSTATTIGDSVRVTALANNSFGISKEI